MQRARILIALVAVIGFVSGFAPVRSTEKRTTTTTTLFSSVESSDSSTASAISATTTGGNQRVAVLLCPAQFCVPDDYKILFENLAKETLENNLQLGTCKVAPLPRTEWIKVARQLPTAEFFKAELPVVDTLGWYFDAMEQAISEIFAEEGTCNVNLCIIGHSIGGWVARAYLGGLSGSSTATYRAAVEACTSLITLGTPHSSPNEALVDQTRGLLKAIEASPACHPKELSEKGIEVTCVCSQSVGASFFTTDIEKLVAASSYLPLVGKFNIGDVKGDGIVPTDLAFLEEPAKKVVLDDCSVKQVPIRHSHVLPTPLNLWDGYAPSIALPEDQFPSYVTEGVVHQWAKYIR